MPFAILISPVFHFRFTFMVVQCCRHSNLLPIGKKIGIRMKQTERKTNEHIQAYGMYTLLFVIHKRRNSDG